MCVQVRVFTSECECFECVCAGVRELGVSVSEREFVCER